MAHAGYRQHKVDGKPARGGVHGGKGLGAKRHLDKTKLQKKTKMASIKNQIRSIERLLKKDLPSTAQEVQKKHLDELKKQAEEHHRVELERKMSLRYRGVKFFERRKIERRIKRLERLLEGTDTSDVAAMEQRSVMAQQLALLKEDLEYVKFFPRTEKYVSLFMGNDDEEVIAKRSKFREQIKANLAAAAVAGVEPEEMDNDDVQANSLGDDDFFLAGSDGEAEDQLAPRSSKPGAENNQSVKRTTNFSVCQTAGLNNQQPYKSWQSSGTSSKAYKQRPGPTYQNQASWSKGQLQHPSTREDSKLKESIINEKPKKAKILPASSNFQSNFHMQTRDPVASRNASRTANSAISSKRNIHSPRFPSQVRIDAVKASIIPESGSLNVDLQKKRRRKHRPKKKKA